MTRRWPPATRDDHETFCRTEGWERTRTARGRASTHHVTYELVLPNGNRLRTRVSRPVDRTTYGANLWAHILRDQLDVSEPVFWRCVTEGTVPDRGGPPPRAETLPASLVHTLLTVARVPESEVRGMTKDQAVERLNRFWSEGG